MSRSRSNPVPPHVGHVRPSGMNSASGRSYHASAPYVSNTKAARSTSSGVSSASPHLMQSTAGIGTPHARWREMHQSGRLAIMLEMRSCPQAGTHFTCVSIASRAAPRSVRAAGSRREAGSGIRPSTCSGRPEPFVPRLCSRSPWAGRRVEGRDPSVPDASNGASIAMNHCEVARKITGLWQRQQCGYAC